MTNDSSTKDDNNGFDNNDKFQRWQKITIEQLSYVTNLLLGLSTALLGFVISMMVQTNITLSCWSKVFFDFGCLLLIVSITLGIFLTINRLWDFRITTRLARGKDDEDRRRSLRDKSKRLGKCTWRLFTGQIVTFGLGLLFLIISIVIIFHEKLF